MKNTYELTAVFEGWEKQNTGMYNIDALFKKFGVEIETLEFKTETPKEYTIYTLKTTKEVAGRIASALNKDDNILRYLMVLERDGKDGR